jgi:hypothetical protein
MARCASVAPKGSLMEASLRDDASHRHLRAARFVRRPDGIHFMVGKDPMATVAARGYLPHMGLFLLIIVLLLLFGGGGFYIGGPAVGGGGLGLILLICLIVFLMGGFRSKK